MALILPSICAVEVDVSRSASMLCKISIWLHAVVQEHSGGCSEVRNVLLHSKKGPEMAGRGMVSMVTPHI